MANKPKGISAQTGFYVAMGVCLLAAAAGALFLLPNGDVPSSQEEAPAEIVADVPAAAETPLTVPMEEASAPEPEPAPTLPEEVPVAAVMPEISVPVADNTPVEAVAPQLIVEPLRGEVAAAFSVDTLLYNETLGDWRIHDGVDITAAAGTTVLAASAGTVLKVEQDALMGTTVIIDHGDGYQTTYANLQAKPTVEKGQHVTAGQVIGAVGTTAAAETAQGPHLHFSVAHDGDAVNPEDYLKR